MKTWWEESADPAFVGYYCFITTLPVMTTYHPEEELPLFAFAQITVEKGEEDKAEYLAESGRQEYILRLPYTAIMLERRKERLS